MKPQNDRQMYLICFGNEIPRKSVFFLPVSRHQSSRNIIDSLRIFNQRSSTGHVESEYISSSQSTVSLFWQEYCNKKENTVYLANELRTWPRALHGLKDKVTYLKTIVQSLYSSLIISFIRFPVGDVPF